MTLRKRLSLVKLIWRLTSNQPIYVSEEEILNLKSLSFKFNALPLPYKFIRVKEDKLKEL